MPLSTEPATFANRKTKRTATCYKKQAKPVKKPNGQQPVTKNKNRQNRYKNKNRQTRHKNKTSNNPLKTQLMKRNEWMALIVTTFLMFAICLSASAKGKKTVERGMTKQEVMTILGQPNLTSFDAYGDRWDYYKINVLTGENKQITVGFDLNGRVVAYNTRFVDDSTSCDGVNNRNNAATDNGQRPIPPCGAVAGGSCRYGHCLDDASFAKLHNKVKSASFDDNKFDLLEVASLGCFYSCEQTARMMRQFSFGDKQLKVLNMMAPHIVDPQNSIVIYNVLTFDSEKTKAGEILRNARQ